MKAHLRTFIPSIITEDAPLQTFVHTFLSCIERRIKERKHMMKVRVKNVFNSLHNRILLFVLILLIIAPVYVFFLYPGLDPSWVWILNYLPYTDYKFGTDIAMNWGPLYVFHLI